MLSFRLDNVVRERRNVVNYLTFLKIYLNDLKQYFIAVFYSEMTDTGH